MRWEREIQVLLLGLDSIRNDTYCGPTTAILPSVSLSRLVLTVKRLSGLTRPYVYFVRSTVGLGFRGW